MRSAIEDELTQRRLYERKVVEWFGPDITKLSQDIASKLKREVLAASCSSELRLLATLAELLRTGYCWHAANSYDVYYVK